MTGITPERMAELRAGDAPSRQEMRELLDSIAGVAEADADAQRAIQHSLALEAALTAASARVGRLEEAANHLLSWFCEAERPIVPRWREDIPGTSIRKILDQFRAALAATPAPAPEEAGQ